METPVLIALIIAGAVVLTSLIPIIAFLWIVKKMFKGGTYTPRSDRRRRL